MGQAGRPGRLKPYDDDDQVGDGTGQAPGAGSVTLGQKVGENGDECGCQCAAGYDRKQQIRQLKSGVVCVEIGTDAKLGANDDVSQQARGRCQAKGEGDDEDVANDVREAGGGGWRVEGGG